MKCQAWVLLCVAIAAPSLVAAETTADPCTLLSNVVTRPTVTSSACTVEPNQVLLETGYSDLNFTSSGNAVSYPQALLRVGTEIPHLEVEFQAPSVAVANGLRGTTDAGASLKYLLGYSPRMQYGAQIYETVPSGSTAFSAGASQSIFAFNTNYALSPALTIATSQNMESLASAGVHYASYAPTLALTASLPHNWGAYGELALATNALGPATSTRSQYMLGASYDAGKRVQLDLEDIFSPTKATGKYNGFGFGVAYLVH